MLTQSSGCAIELPIEQNKTAPGDHCTTHVVAQIYAIAQCAPSLVHLFNTFLIRLLGRLCLRSNCGFFCKFWKKHRKRERVTTSSHRSFCRGIYWNKPVLVGVLEIKIEVRFQPQFLSSSTPHERTSLVQRRIITSNNARRGRRVPTGSSCVWSLVAHLIGIRFRGFWSHPEWYWMFLQQLKNISPFVTVQDIRKYLEYDEASAMHCTQIVGNGSFPRYCSTVGQRLLLKSSRSSIGIAVADGQNNSTLQPMFSKSF